MCFASLNEKIKKLNCTDMALIKISVIAFTLMVAKLWSPILSLDWYWYALVFIVVKVYLVVKIFGK